MPYNLPEQKGRSILQVALDVHSTTMGSLERRREDQDLDVFLLENKLAHWDPIVNERSFAFDRAVKNLITMAVAEVLNSERS